MGVGLKPERQAGNRRPILSLPARERGLRPIHRRQPFESLRVLNEVEGEPAPTQGDHRERELAPTGTIFCRSLRWSISSRPSCYPVLIVILRMLGGEPTDKQSLSVPPVL